MGWENRIVGLTFEDPEQLLAHPSNPKFHPNKQREALRASLDDLGWVAPVIVNDASGYCVDGHARIEDAISAGEKKIPVLHVELDPEEEAEMLLIFDPIAGLSRGDQARIDELMASVHADPRLDDLLASLRSTAIPTDAEDLVSFDTDDPEFRSVVLIYTQDKYDEFTSLLDDITGSSVAEKVLIALRNAVIVQ